MSTGAMEGYDIEIAQDLALPEGYALGGLLTHPDWLGRHVIRESDERACVARCCEDLSTQVTSTQLDAAIARAHARMGAERETQSALELEGLEDLEVEWHTDGDP